MLLYVALMLPNEAFDLLPIASLIGALLSLGNLARSMELTVVRAAGVSTARIALWVLSAGVVLMIMTAALGEYLAPQAEQYGRQMKTFEKYKDYSMAGQGGAWAKDGDTIFSVRQQNAGNIYGGVYVFKFDPQHRLRSVGQAKSANIDADNRWGLTDYRESRLEGDRVVASRQTSAEIASRLSPEFLGLAIVTPETLPARGLYIVVLAVPFAFGPMRSTGTGARTVVGILLGVTFFLLAKMMESGGAVFELPPVIVAWVPTAILAVVTVFAVSRVR